METAIITCKHCSNSISENSTVFCETHLIKNRERGLKDRKRRKEAGLCRSCNEPISPNSKTWCTTHHEKQNVLSREHSEKTRATELCEDCLKEPRMLRKRKCVKCQEKFLAAKKVVCRRVGCEDLIDPTLKHFCRSHGDEENEKLKQRRLRLKAEKKCIFCFNKIEEDSHILCVDCRNKQKEQRKAATAG